MSFPRVVLCTGANQGLGLAILQAAALRDPSPIYILACRNVASGNEALNQLRGEGIKAEIEVFQLDVTNDEHITSAIKFVESKYGRLDVLINNAGILIRAPEDDLPALRQAYNTMLNTNLTSVAILTTAFLPLLHKSPDPKVINITSGLGSIANTLTKKMGRLPPYGASKVGMNGLTAHMQTAENDRIAAEEVKGEGIKEGRIKYYVVAPGLLKTALTSFHLGKDPKDGTGAVVRLIEDQEGKYPAGTQWEFVEEEMRVVPW
ncbi:short chain dehydrogenase/reductase family protein [Cenococcum geophilum 1.58]|uniref:short chain dehydrogenase/reductase family protein n=1 Tax=Cenococcum geophilum 1.58 TaxID=794803 RepID=UPI0035901A8F|nr:short chain dehydrogenase/reductase family protein [Cenococcum geophilum 1.58]